MGTSSTIMKTSSSHLFFPRGRSLVLAEAVVLLVSLLGATQADFSDQCPSACRCKWANGKREADCTDAGFNAVPTHLHHEIQVESDSNTSCDNGLVQQLSKI